MKATVFCSVVLVVVASLCKGEDQVMRITDEKQENFAVKEFIIENYSDNFVASLIFTVDNTTYDMYICKSLSVDLCSFGIKLTKTPEHKTLYQYKQELTSSLWLSFTTDGKLTIGKGSVIGKDSLFTSAEASNSQIITITEMRKPDWYITPFVQWLDLVEPNSGKHGSFHLRSVDCKNLVQVIHDRVNTIGASLN
ncbi:hypothetical protein CAPTEDRAFT_196419 [Capitella teleta]|uniref:Farnesoic acid O-methyl transferase domain-containing protein n=1 Tax=Capitella teleta TaxID=283909 RepID=R7V1M5_CAPTE|nr:hypothetical protein CAPTEDRAFT_196419 [Capitella teleta]|eukprot:ELU12743.1 hypothetical protein CAPTEDRAFT_196419 [Capitella teleta]